MLVLYLVLGILAFVGGAFVAAYSNYVRQSRREILETAVVAITVPKENLRRDDVSVTTEQGKDFKELDAVSEQLIASFHSLHIDHLVNDLLEMQPTLGLEIVSLGGQISFYLTCPRSEIKLLVQQIHSFAPHAEVAVTPGYNLFDSGNETKVASATLGEEKRHIFPIRTYRYLDSEPLNNLTNVLAQLGSGSNAAIQILVKPLSDRWRINGIQAANEVLRGKQSYIYSRWWQRALANSVGWIQGGLRKSQAPPGTLEREEGQIKMRNTPAQEELMKAFTEKSSKVGFRAVIRIVSVASDISVAKNNRDNILAAFSQFNAPAWNGFYVKAKEDSDGRIANDFVLKTLGREWGMLLNSEEIASIWHLPNRFTETPNIRWLVSRTLPAPLNLPQEGIVVGNSVFRGETTPVRIKSEDRRRHIFMIGKTGVGKTTLFENMVDQDIRAGAGVAFIDPNGDAVESILQKIPKERAKDVIYFDPSDISRPLGLNMLEWQHPEEKDFLVAEWIEIFYKLFDPNRIGMVGPQFEHWGRNASLTVMALPGGGTLIDIPRLFTDDRFREYAVSYVSDPVVKAFWEQQLAKTADFHKSEMFNYFISKFGRFMTNDLMRNIIGQTKSSFDMREIMDKKKILLVNLAKGKIGEANSYLLGMILVSKIQTAAFARADVPEDQRRDFYLYVDEFQNFTTDTFAIILSEARKYRLNLAITNQYIAQLTEKVRDAVIGNAGTLITYRIGAADAEFMVKEFPGVSIDDVVNLEKYTTYTKLLIDGTPSKPFTMKGILSPVERNNERGEAIRQLSRLNYGKDVSQVENEFANQMNLGASPIPASQSTATPGAEYR